MKLIPLALLLTFFLGCSKRDDSAIATSTVAIKTNAPPPEIISNRLSTAEFFKRIYLPEYEQVGTKDPRWDAAAKNFLGLLATSAGAEVHDHALHQEIDAAMKAVQKTLCEDPLVRYMILRRTRDSHSAGTRGTNEWVEVALDLDASGYHPYWRFFSFMRAAQALKSGSQSTTNESVWQFRTDTSSRLIALLQDYTLPASVVLDAVNQWVNKDLARNSSLRNWIYDQIEGTLFHAWGDTAEAHLIRGAYYVHHAWDARGSGWSRTVTDEGWKLMYDRLNVARQTLKHAWNIKPMEEIALQMQWVEIGDSKGRLVMEEWFNKALMMNPASYAACENKITWLHPKWYGSDADLIAFGRECLTNKNGRIPLILQEAHRQLAEYHGQRNDAKEKRYWKKPGVWEDCKASFEAFFEINPQAASWRHNYALCAYKCEKWNDLRKQLKLLGPVNYSYFDGEEAFNEMVRKAEELGRE